MVVGDLAGLAVDQIAEEASAVAGVAVEIVAGRVVREAAEPERERLLVFWLSCDGCHFTLQLLTRSQISSCMTISPL